MMLRNARRGLGLGLALCASVALSGAALAQGDAAEKAVSARQAGFKQIGSSFKAINDELKRGKPDMGAVATAAGRLQGHAAQVPTWFPRGSGVESGAKTAARAEIWSDAAGFADAAANLKAQTERLAALARAGDPAATRKQAAQVGAACKTCHTKYREAD